MNYTYFLLFAVAICQKLPQFVFGQEEKWEKQYETKVKSIILRKLNRNLDNQKLSNFSNTYSKSFIKRFLEEESKEKIQIVIAAEKVLNNPTEITFTINSNTIDTPTQSMPASTITNDAMSTTTTAKLYFYKKPTVSDSDVLILYVKLNGSVVSTITVSKEYTGWLDADVSAAFQMWVKYFNGNTNSFSFLCEGCNDNYFEVSSENQHIPYLLTNIAKVKYLPRQQHKRWSCNQESSCCSRPVFVSFEDLSWNWVLSPKGFWTNKCVGNCKSNKQGSSNCCLPVEHESITMFYHDSDYSFYAKKLITLLQKNAVAAEKNFPRFSRN